MLTPFHRLYQLKLRLEGDLEAVMNDPKYAHESLPGGFIQREQEALSKVQARIDNMVGLMEALEPQQ